MPDDGIMISSCHIVIYLFQYSQKIGKNIFVRKNEHIRGLRVRNVKRDSKLSN